MARSPGHDPGLQEGGLPFGLSLVDGRGVVTLCRPTRCGPALLELLDFFRFQTSGQSKFQKATQLELGQSVFGAREVQGEPLTLRYLVWINRRGADEANVAEVYAAYVEAESREVK